MKAQDLNKHKLDSHMTDDEILGLIFTKQNKICQCGHKKFYKVKHRKCYECGKCAKQIYPLKGTIMESTKLPLHYWLLAMREFHLTRNGVSAKILQRRLDVTYKVAWNMAKKIRTLMAEPTNDQLSGIIEVDESYIGGKSKDKKNSFSNKTTVFGMLERGGRVRVFAVENRNKETILPLIRKHAKQGSIIYTDEHGMYSCLGDEGYTHDSVNHGQYNWARGDVSTNSIEGFWSRLKNSLRGTHIHVSHKHLQTYLDEFAFRHNRRKNGDAIFDDMMKLLIQSSVSRNFDG